MYSLDTVNDLSTKIIRIALALFCIQALVQIALAVWVIRIDAIITSAINIFFFLMIFYLAVRCVKGRNATVCCGCRALDLYRLYIMVALFVLLLNVLGSIAMIIHDPLLGSIALVVYSTLFTLNSLELYYSNKLIKELNTSVRPEKSIMVPAQASAQQTNVPLAEVQFVHTV